MSKTPPPNPQRFAHRDAGLGIEARDRGLSQFSIQQQARALTLLEQMTWGDMDHWICGLETCLRLALEASAEGFQEWEHDLGPAMEDDGYDEFSVPRDRIEEMSSEERLAYVARLIRSLALSYGVSAEFGGARTGLVGEATKVSPAALLRGLNDITWTPTT